LVPTLLEAYVETLPEYLGYIRGFKGHPELRG
jgi:hypothetical protein